MKTIEIQARTPRLKFAGLWMLLVSFALCGCQGGANVYKASRLPPELMAARAPSTKQLNLSRLAGPNYGSATIQPGDLLDVSIATGLEEKQPIAHALRVADDGTTDVPLVGQVRLAGLEVTNAGNIIGQESVRRGVYVTPTVAVSVKQRRTNQITVMGSVESPGVKNIPVSNCSLLTVLAEAGGLSKGAGTIVEIQHPAFVSGRKRVPPRSQKLDLKIATQQGGDFRLLDGATVTVLERPPRMIHVMGLVNQPDQFELPDDQDLRLLDALSLAGGRTLQLADKVKLMRTAPNGEPVVINTSVREAKQNGAANVRLAAGDVVSVEETPLTFTVATLQSFLRFGFSAAIPGF